MSPAAPAPTYAELQVTSNFSFLRGASHPEEMVERAAELGYRALALTDRNTLAGVVRAHEAALRTGLHFIPGARLDPGDGPSLLCLPTTRHGYGALSRLITTGRRRAPKGECHLTREDVAAAADPAGHVFIAVPPVTPGDDFADDLAWYRDRLAAPLHLAATHYHRGDDDRRLARLAELAETHGVPLVATGDIHQHDPSRRRLHDTLTCIREHCTIDNAGWRLEANAERHLKSAAELARRNDVRSELLRDVESLLEGAAEPVAVAERWAEHGIDTVSWWLTGIAQDAIRTRSAPQLPASNREVLRVAGETTLADWFLLLEACLAARDALARRVNPNERLALESLVLAGFGAACDDASD